MEEMSARSEKEALQQWAENQRALARALGLTIEEWLECLDAAGRRTTGLTAAVVGAAMARGLGMSVLDGLDGARLAKRARDLIDPRPPRVKSPLLKEAIRRADDLGLKEGGGARLLRGRRASEPPIATLKGAVPTPVRDARPVGGSADFATPDSPGTQPKTVAPPKRKRRKKRIGLMDDEETSSFIEVEDLKKR
jgi:hypothetical protein